MIYYGIKQNDIIANVICYETVDNVPQEILETWEEITEQEYDNTIERYANVGEDDTPSLEQRINDIELALMEIAEVM